MNSQNTISHCKQIIRAAAYACICGFLLLCQVQLYGQSILDDTTKQVYGPSTTLHFYEQDVFYNDTSYHLVDTSLYGFENFEPVDQSGRRYQHLGNIGTALFPIFYDLPEDIGTSSGFNVYDPYRQEMDKRRYFDTKSSYMDVSAVLGADTRSQVDFIFTQNIKPNINFGFDIKRQVADKQLGRVGQGDRNTESTTVNVFTSYLSKNQKYNLLFTAQTFKHRVDEIGGIVIDTTELIITSPDDITDTISRFAPINRASLFQYTNAQIALDGPENIDARLGFRLYHQYEVKPFIQLYHIMNRERQQNTYVDNDVASGIDFYRNTFLSSTTTTFLSSFTDFKNEVGLKGNIGPAFYNAYLKRRDINHNTYGYAEPNVIPFGRFSENYLGGRTRLKIENVGQLIGNFEFLFENADVKLDALLESSYFNAYYKIRKYRPTLLAQQYFGNHYAWRNGFNSVFSNELGGDVKLKYKGIDISPSIKLKTYDRNFIYYDQEAEPTTAGDDIVMAHWGLGANWSFKKKFFLENQLVYTQLDDNDARIIRLPRLFYQGKLYAKGNWFKKTIPVMYGLNLYGRGAYRANAYDPVTQQFYLEDDFSLNGNNLIEPYLAVDAFFNARVSNVFIFFKWVHVNQPAEDGYFATPFYNGQRRVIDVGIRWMFYD